LYGHGFDPVFPKISKQLILWRWVARWARVGNFLFAILNDTAQVKRATALKLCGIGL